MGREFRINQEIRDSLAETSLSRSDLIMPYFVNDSSHSIEISAMPGILNHSIGSLISNVQEQLKFGISSMLLFGSTENQKNKTNDGSYAYHEEGITQTAVRALKKEFGNDLTIITDVCICSFTNHGHCGVAQGENILNDETLPILAKIAKSHADAGADIISPSDMMDNRVQFISDYLKEEINRKIPLFSYAAKFASSYYGPFREAADSSPKFGDRKSYQMDYRNSNEAMSEIQEDLDQGADGIIFKPALAFLDILARATKKFDTRKLAYNVSGEYSMVKAAGMKGWINEKEIIIENLFCMKRAGATDIITYHALEVAKNNWIK